MKFKIGDEVWLFWDNEWDNKLYKGVLDDKNKPYGSSSVWAVKLLEAYEEDGTVDRPEESYLYEWPPECMFKTKQEAVQKEIDQTGVRLSRLKKRIKKLKELIR